ncbi:hypothetical protein B7494_g456 [Chlorociboria aeruginascens]|nr:hypothetical protein B7494_g456 [Chlorociboria aeruginascens]
MEEEVKTVLPARPDASMFQSIEDFMKEQDKLDALRAETTPERPLKKIQLSTNPGALFVEAVNEAIFEIGETNWIGKLGAKEKLNRTEYRTANPSPSGIIYTEGVISVDSVQRRFTCTASIDESTTQFGSSGPSFSKKKDAKQYAAKKAIDYLVSQNLMPSDGSVKFPKPPNQSTPPVGYKPAGGFANQVPALCIRLGFRVPRYMITAVTLEPPMYTVYADFGGDPIVQGKVGLVQNVFGKKNAKENCAEIVVAFLRDIERQRGLGEGEGTQRKRFSGSGDEIDVVFKRLQEEFKE